MHVLSHMTYRSVSSIITALSLEGYSTCVRGTYCRDLAIGNLACCQRPSLLGLGPGPVRSFRCICTTNISELSCRSLLYACKKKIIKDEGFILCESSWAESFSSSSLYSCLSHFSRVYYINIKAHSRIVVFINHHWTAARGIITKVPNS
jgi:hypothetical protein